jgi:hypothetical protein
MNHCHQMHQTSVGIDLVPYIREDVHPHADQQTTQPGPQAHHVVLITAPTVCLGQKLGMQLCAYIH